MATAIITLHEMFYRMWSGKTLCLIAARDATFPFVRDAGFVHLCEWWSGGATPGRI